MTSTQKIFKALKFAVHSFLPASKLGVVLLIFFVVGRSLPLQSVKQTL